MAEFFGEEFIKFYAKLIKEDIKVFSTFSSLEKEVEAMSKLF